MFKKNKFPRLLYDLYIYCCLFVIMYQPPVLSINLMHFVGLFSWFIILKQSRTKIDFIYIKWMIFFSLVLCYLLFFCSLINQQPLSSISFPIYYLLEVIPFVFVLFEYLKKYGLTIYDFFKILILTGFIQSLLSIIAFFSVTIKDIFTFLILSNSGWTENASMQYWAGVRMNGFSSSLMFAMPVVQGILSIISFYLFLKKFGKKYLFFSFTLFISGMLNARTTFIVVGIGIVIILLSNTLSIRRIVILLISLASLLLFITFLIIPMLEKKNPVTYEWISAGIGEILSFFKGTGNNTIYFSYLGNEEVYSIPSNWKLLFGEGYTIMLGYNPFHVYSDIGYINDIWLGGICFVIILYSFLFFNLLYIFRAKNDLIKFVGLFLFFVLPIVNIKGMAISTMNPIMNFTVLFCILSELNMKKRAYGY